MNNRYEIAREFVEAISSDNIVQTILFGSVARGDDTNESDIDILIIIRSDNRQVEDMIDKMVVDFILEKEEVISKLMAPKIEFNTYDYALDNIFRDVQPIDIMEQYGDPITGQ